MDFAYQAQKITELKAGFEEERIEKLVAQAQQRSDAIESANETLKTQQESLREAQKNTRDAMREEMRLQNEAARASAHSSDRTPRDSLAWL